MDVLRVENIRKTFIRGTTRFVAVDDVSFHIDEGECVGLVGESGCGKSTIAKIITHLTEPDQGTISLLGKDITKARGKTLRNMYREMQMVFQMPTDSFNPRIKIGRSIEEVMINYGRSRGEATKRMLELLDLVELKREYKDRYPHQLSGGECQRAAIARALAIQPKLLICDEATSALDVSVQAQIVELMKRLQKEMNLSYLFICHDLALVKHLCQRVFVMHRGSIVESGKTEDVICNPGHPYTKMLLSSIFPIDPDLKFQIPIWKDQGNEENYGCKFWERCSCCTEWCKKNHPENVLIGTQHQVACYHLER